MISVFFSRPGDSRGREVKRQRSHDVVSVSVYECILRGGGRRCSCMTEACIRVPCVSVPEEVCVYQCGFGRPQEIISG